MQVAELVNAIIVAKHPHFRNVVHDAVPFVAVKMADVEGDQTLQHIVAFLEQACAAPRGKTLSITIYFVHVLTVSAGTCTNSRLLQMTGSPDLRSPPAELACAWSQWQHLVSAAKAGSLRHGTSAAVTRRCMRDVSQ